MSQAEEQLGQSLSTLSLDAAGHATRKSKRPARAYHNVTAGMASPDTLGPGVFPQNAQLMNNNGNVNADPAFTPKAFNSPAMSTPATPTIASTDRASPYATALPTALPIHTMSHIVPTQRWEDQLQYLTKSFETAKNSVPPLATTQFYCVDQGTCDPRLMSLTMYNVPKNEQMRKATQLPLGLSIQPFAHVIPEEPIPAVDSRNINTGPLRCKRCRAYVNPAFRFNYDSTATCNICEVTTKMPADTFVPLGPDGLRADHAQRADLSSGCVDFLVPDMYNVIQGTQPLPLHYIFLIDVSLLANENGSSLAAVEGVRTCIEHISDFQPNCEVAIITYDSKLRFYNLRSELKAVQEHIITELDDVFLPFYRGLFVKPQESMSVIDDTLRKITAFITLDKFSHVPQVCYGSALKAAKLALQAVTGGQGGKIICTLNSLPTIGDGNLSLRKDDNQKKHLRCDNDYYNKVAHEMLRSYISLDLYVTSSAFVDMLTVAYPVQVTSGVLKYYPHFRHDKDNFTLVNDMLQNVTDIVGYQALLKVRCSSGLSVYQYYMEASDNSDKDPIIPVLTKNTTIDVLLKYVEKLKPATDVHFQAALLYTDIDGNRKVRSINSNAAVSSNIHEVYKFVNQATVLRIMAKDVITTLSDCDFAKTKKLIDNKIASILTQYRALVSGNSSSQLVLPDTLKTLPTYMLAFEKSELFKPNTHTTRGNERVYDYFKYWMYNSTQLQYKLYPQIIPIHVLLDEDDLVFYDANDKLLQIVPDSLENLSVRASYAQLVDGGCYFMFNGEGIYLWFNENTNDLLLEDLLSVDTTSTPFSKIELTSYSLPETGTAINNKAANLLKYWSQAANKTALPLVLIRPKVDNYYSAVMGTILTEDATMNKIEACDGYLIALHRQIQEKLKKQDYIKLD